MGDTLSFFTECKECMNIILMDFNNQLVSINMHRLDLNSIKHITIKHKKFIKSIEHLTQVEVKTPMKIILIPYDKAIVQIICNQIKSHLKFLTIDVDVDKIIIKLSLPTRIQRLSIIKHLKQTAEEKKINIRQK